MFGAKKAAEPTSPAKSSRPTTPPKTSQSAWSGWAGTAAVGGALLAGAAAGVAYYKDDLNLSVSWATDHLKYVGNLWDTESLDQRVEDLIDIERDHGVIFKTWVYDLPYPSDNHSCFRGFHLRSLYTVLPPNPPEFLTSRTFVVLPKYTSRAKPHFLPANNATASDEIQGHVGMFAGNTNDGYYKLGLDCADIIRDAVLASRGIAPSNSSSKEPNAGTYPSSKDEQNDLIQF